MRIGVLDVGSNSAHLKIVDLAEGRPPRTVATLKHPTRLAEAIDPDGTIGEEAVCRLVGAVGQAACTAALHGVDELVAFATSAVRDATDRDEILARVADRTGVELGFLTGGQEATLTFHAVRAWYGWSAGGCWSWTSAAAPWRSPPGTGGNRTWRCRCRSAPAD